MQLTLDAAIFKFTINILSRIFLVPNLPSKKIKCLRDIIKKEIKGVFTGTFSRWNLKSFYVFAVAIREAAAEAGACPSLSAHTG